MPTLFDPFEQLREFQRAIDAFRSSGWLGSGLSAGGAYPPINVFRKGDDIVAIIEVPGVRKSEWITTIARGSMSANRLRRRHHDRKNRDDRRHGFRGRRSSRSVHRPTAAHAEH